MSQRITPLRSYRFSHNQQKEQVFRIKALAQAIASAVLGMAVIASVASAILPSQAIAAEAAVSRDYQIAAGPLGTALSEFAAAAGVTLSFDPSQVAGLQSPGLRGNVSVKQGFDRITEGTGFEIVAQSDTSYLLRKIPVQSLAPRDAAVSVLPELAVSVSGKAPGSITEGTGSYTTWSTSSSTRLNLSLQETPQAITVMTRQRMDDQGLISLNDILDATAGITVKPFGFGADGPQLWARGSSITNFQVDGVPMSSSMSNYLQSNVIYDRVEIVKGATGMMSGLGTPSATINMIRKRPTLEPKTSLTAEAGNWSRYGAGIDISRPLNEDGSVRARLVADYKRQGAWTDDYRQDYGVLYGIGEIDLTDSTLLTLGFSHITRNTDAPIRSFPILYTNGQPTGAKPSDQGSPKWTYYDHRHNSIFASLEHKIGSGWSAKAEVTHARYKYEAVIASLVGDVNQATGAGARAQMPLWASETKQTSLDAYVTGPFSLFGQQHELIGGVTLSQIDGEGPNHPVARQNITDIFNWANETAEPSFSKTGHTTSKEYQYSAYLSTRLQLSEATSLLLGGRITDWKRDRKSLTYASNDVSETHDRERNVVIPYAGIVHALNDTYALYASYTKIFNPQGDRVRDVNNRPLDPEEGTSYEAGIKASFKGGALTSSLSVFRTEQDRLALYNAAVVAYETANNATTKGVELELNGELAPGWQFSSGYTYSETTNREGERIMTRIPRNIVKVFTIYRLPGDWNRFTLGGGVNWESKTGDPLPVYTQEHYALVNLMARYEVNKQLSITAHLNNVLNKEYYVAVAGANGTYGPPRNFMASLKYTF
ncbi:TonB-dependent receptor [Methylobacillus arboreus]|uniref:TonB-dependent siderophore receptor n=1 Tax=Methylobacillus arboreus TaxID=755170 RepID=UPI001E4B971D|nr:TonB-dependent receptor [Methylobacillus arboreus]MCB5191005.1 TonB-dependent receptor [Methylobacillus arboreus]